jgi:hypothetical protein
MQMLTAPIQRQGAGVGVRDRFLPAFAVDNTVQAADLRLDNIPARCEHNCKA